MQLHPVISMSLTVICAGALYLLKKYGARVDAELGLDDADGTSGAFTFVSAPLRNAVAAIRPRRWSIDKPRQQHPPATAAPAGAEEERRDAHVEQHGAESIQWR